MLPKGRSRPAWRFRISNPSASAILISARCSSNASAMAAKVLRVAVAIWTHKHPNSSICSPPARWGLLDFIRAVFLLRLRILRLHLRSPDPSGHSRASTASSRSQWALPDLHRELQIPVGTAGPQPRLPGRSGHCRTSTATSRSHWPLPDLNREPQIAVGTAGPQREECQKRCQIECQKICQIECQKECQKICQTECQKICQKECQKICQTECQKICQIECPKNVRRYAR